MSGPQRRSALRSARVSYYFDADVLGLAKIIAAIRPDVTYPGDPGAQVRGRHRAPCPVTSPDTLDHVWIPIVSNAGWAVITRDQHISRRPAERQAVIDHSGRLFAITSRQQLNKWDQLEILMARWRDIEHHARAPGPGIFSVTYSAVRRLL